MAGQARGEPLPVLTGTGPVDAAPEQRPCREPAPASCAPGRAGARGPAPDLAGAPETRGQGQAPQRAVQGVGVELAAVDPDGDDVPEPAPPAHLRVLHREHQGELLQDRRDIPVRVRAAAVRAIEQVQAPRAQGPGHGGRALAGAQVLGHGAADESVAHDHVPRPRARRVHDRAPVPHPDPHPGGAGDGEVLADPLRQERVHLDAHLPGARARGLPGAGERARRSSQVEGAHGPGRGQGRPERAGHVLHVLELQVRRVRGVNGRRLHAVQQQGRPRAVPPDLGVPQVRGEKHR